MTCTLAKAVVAPLNADGELVLMAVAVLAVVAAAAALPAVITTRRRHRHREGLSAAVVLWGVVTAGVVIWAVNRDGSAAAERQRQILSGDYDPRDLPPPTPSLWPAWCGLALAYAGLIGWAATGPMVAGAMQAAPAGLPIQRRDDDWRAGQDRPPPEPR